MRILHIAAYDRNIGDSIAIVNARKCWSYTLPDIEWFSLDIGKFWHPIITEKIFIDMFKEIEAHNFDAILLGGGGLIEYGGYEKSPTKWKLPFNQTIFEAIKTPVYFHAVGVNIFRGGIEYSNEAKEAIQYTINNAAGFSVRNDGSYEKLRDWMGLDVTNVDVVADPGMLFLDGLVDRKETVTQGAIQPAFNGSEGININRFKSKANIKAINIFTKDLINFPHTLKDFNRIDAKPITSFNDFENIYQKTNNLNKFLNLYKDIDYVIAMRGHGQLITIGMNIPGIYFSTQDKVRDFSLLNGFEDYNVDIEDSNWLEKLKGKVNKLTEPNSTYLRKWYEIRDEQLNKWDNITVKTVTKWIQNYEMSSMSLGE